MNWPTETAKRQLKGWKTAVHLIFLTDRVLSTRWHLGPEENDSSPSESEMAALLRIRTKPPSNLSCK